MVGTINLSLTQQLDEFGEPLSGGQLYFIQAGTVSTPQNAYQDTALTIPWPNPITLDAAGRIPMFYLADGQIKVRLQDAMGVVKFQQDNLLVIGPSAGGGGGGSVDATTVLQTGDIKFRYDTAVISGFVRLNGKTIGSASSGASELADPSAQALFQFLWNTDSALNVSSGRGASASADWTANKRITLPDGRARFLAALGDMGNTDIGLWGNAFFTRGSPTTLGAFAGNGTTPNYQVTLMPGNLPPYTPSGSVGTSISGGSLSNILIYGGGSAPGGVTVLGGASTATLSVSASSSFSGNSQGGTSTPFGVCPAVMLITVYMKL